MFMGHKNRIDQVRGGYTYLPNHPPHGSRNTQTAWTFMLAEVVQSILLGPLPVLWWYIFLLQRQP